MSATKGRAWNHAAAFNVAARAELERRECLANPDRPRKRAWSTAAVARALGVPSTQWHNWVVGRQSPSTARLVEWLRAWEGAGLPPLTVTTTAMGVEVGVSHQALYHRLAEMNEALLDACDDELAAVLTLLCRVSWHESPEGAAIWARADAALVRWAALSEEAEE